MVFNAQVLRVMVASPGDVTADRQTVVSALHEWNRVHSPTRKISLSPWLWETDAVPLMGDHPQTQINRQGLDDSDIVIALFRSRLGSPTPDAVSGTASEIARATAAGKFVHVYFSDQGHPADVNTGQLEALRDFKEEIHSLGLLGDYNPATLATQIQRAIEHDLRALNARDAATAAVKQPPDITAVDPAGPSIPQAADPIQELNLLIENQGPGARAVHNRVRAEASRLEALKLLNSSHDTFTSMTYAQRLPQLETELRTWAGYTALLASWPGKDTDRWWAESIDHYGGAPRLSGYVDAIDSFRAPAAVMMYAGGVAAASQQRFDFVCELLTDHPVASRYRNERVPASATIGASTMYPGNQWPSRRLASYLGPILANDVALGTTPTVEGWERLEYIWLLVSWRRSKRGEEYTWFHPYMRVDDDRTHRTSKGLRPLASTWLEEARKPFSQVTELLFDGDASELRDAMRDVDESIAEVVDRSETSTLMRPGVAVWMPTGVRRALFPPGDDEREPWPPVGSSAGN